MTILGQLGEAPKLTKRGIAPDRQARHRSCGGRLPIVVGVTAPGLAPMRELADSVMDMGASGVMVAPPWTTKTDDQAYAFYVSVGEPWARRRGCCRTIR